MTLTYYIDAANIIIGTDGDWDRNSEANCGPPDSAYRVLGTRLWDHIDNADTRSYLNAIFFAARCRKTTISLLYRCDTPQEARQFRMTISAGYDNELMVTHTPCDLVPSRLPTRVLEAGKTYHTPRCSICCAHLVDDQWIDPMRHRAARFTASVNTVCTSCKAVASDVLTDVFPKSMAQACIFG